MSVNLTINKNVKIAMNKSLLKEFNRNNERVVYLEDGDEFQIQIFNDQTTEIGAKIFVNGEQIANSFLVIRPGERVWLDRYFDKNRKFKFSTYEVNGNSETVKKAIKKNGIIEVQLYRKSPLQGWPFANDGITWNKGTWTPYQSPSTYPYEPLQIYYNADLDFGVSSSASSIFTCGCTNTSASETITSLTSPNCSTSTYKTCSAEVKLKKDNKMETGRIVEGGCSDQEFDYVDMTFESWYFDSEKIHILPKSVKPVYSNELQKIYCHSCGRKLKTKFNFCPFCGAKQ